jgi:hypothetical protein
MYVQNLFSTVTGLQKYVATKLCIKIGRMSNQRKAEFVNGDFCMQSSWGDHGEISPKARLMSKGVVCPDF